MTYGKAQKWYNTRLPIFGTIVYTEIDRPFSFTGLDPRESIESRKLQGYHKEI
jgi:hypothetical protein